MGEIKCSKAKRVKIKKKVLKEIGKTKVRIRGIMATWRIKSKISKNNNK